MRKLKFIDLFAGMGGFRLGFEQSCRENGFQSVCVFSSEIKESAIKVYKSNFGEECLNGDIFKIKEKDLTLFDFVI